MEWSANQNEPERTAEPGSGRSNRARAGTKCICQSPAPPAPTHRAEEPSPQHSRARDGRQRTSCCSTRLTTGSTYGLPSSVRKAPTPRLILPGVSSARNAELRPRMGSGGASGTPAKTLVAALAGAVIVAAMAACGTIVESRDTGSTWRALAQREWWARGKRGERRQGAAQVEGQGDDADRDQVGWIKRRRPTQLLDVQKPCLSAGTPPEKAMHGVGGVSV